MDDCPIGSLRESASTAINAYWEYFADRIVAEINHLVEDTLRNIDRNISYRGIRATRGKIVRAELIARGLVHHVGSFPLLENEMYSYCGLDNEQSPDRLDALVWALTDPSHRYGGNRAILTS
jgi:phage terminase large subunit-like protein